MNRMRIATEAPRHQEKQIHYFFFFVPLCLGGFLLILNAAGCAESETKQQFASPLAGLALPHGGTAKHEGSWDRKGGNADARSVAPGETLTLLDYHSAGVIHRFWVTIAPRAEMHIHRQAILRMYWDGEEV